MPTVLTEAELLALPAEDYMNAEQQQFFRALLLNHAASYRRVLLKSSRACAKAKPIAILSISAALKSSVSGNCACWSEKRSYWIKSIKHWTAWPVENMAGAERRVSPSDSSVCYYGLPQACASRPKNARSNAKDTCATTCSDASNQYLIDVM